MSSAPSFDTAIELALPVPGVYDVVVDRSPVLSAHAAIVDVITGQPTASPELRALITRALGAEGLGHYARIRAGAGRAFYPRLTVPTIDRSARWVTEAGDAIGDTSTDTLVDELQDMQRLQDGAGWEPVINHPRAWLTGIAAAFTRVATAIAPSWQRAAERLAVEEARLDLIRSTPEAIPHLVNGLSPSVRLDPDALRIKWAETSHELLGERLVLTPMIGAGSMSYLVLQTPRGTAFGYSMAAGLRRAGTGAVPAGRLVALLGEHRAQILRRLDRPQTLTQVADDSTIALSTASHHVDKLRAAGLVATMRLHRASWVMRTDVGETLLHLLD